MQRLEVSGAVRPIYGSLGVKRLMTCTPYSGDQIEKSEMGGTCSTYGGEERF